MRKQTTIWKTRDGRKVRICDMTDQHLFNTLRYLSRLAAVTMAAELAAGYSVLSTLQGEMAQFFCEQDLDRLQEESEDDWLEQHCPQWPALLADADRRGWPWPVEDIVRDLPNLRLAAEVHFTIDKPRRSVKVRLPCDKR